MFSQLFALVKNDAGVKAKLGNSVRVYPFGKAPQQGQPGYALPYAVYQTVFGGAEEYLGERSDMDTFGVQIDVYALEPADADTAAEAIRYAIELHSSISGFRDGTDLDTDLAFKGFTAEFFKPRT